MLSTIIRILALFFGHAELEAVKVTTEVFGRSGT